MAVARISEKTLLRGCPKKKWTSPLFLWFYSPSIWNPYIRDFPSMGWPIMAPWSTFTPHMGFLLKGPTHANFSSINKLELTLSKNLCQKQSLIMDFFRWSPTQKFCNIFETCFFIFRCQLLGYTL